MDVKNPSGPTDEEEQGNTLSMSWFSNNGYRFCFGIIEFFLFFS